MQMNLSLSRYLLGVLCLMPMAKVYSAPPSPTHVAGKTLAEWMAHYESGDARSRLQAVYAAVRFGLPSQELLTDALSDPGDAVRGKAAEGLGRYGTAADEALPALTGLLQDESVGVRICAAYAVYRMGARQQALPVLIEALSYNNRGTPIVAADFLGELVVKEAIPALQRAAKNKDYHVRNAASRAITNIRKGIESD